MWLAAWIVIVASWLFFHSRSRSLARVVDRFEVAVLKPLGITYLVLLVTFAVGSGWALAACSAAASLLNGAIGASLHRSRSFSELSAGTIQYMAKGPKEELSHDESFRLARVVLPAVWVAWLWAFAVLLGRSTLRWYWALPAAWLMGFLLVLLPFLAAYSPWSRGRKPDAV